MKRLYLGDSYDAVKRLWQEIFAEWAPLYADPRFIPAELRPEFTKLTKIPVLGSNRPETYSVLNDPDTGVHAPDRIRQGGGVSHSHVSLSEIRGQLSDQAVRCVVTFDQSKHRTKERSAEDQRAAKLHWLKANQLAGFYYVSHAPFMFACLPNELETVMMLLVGAGIPRTRIQPCA